MSRLEAQGMSGTAREATASGLLAGLVVIGVACAAAPAPVPRAGDGGMVDLLEVRCSACHSTDLIFASGGTPTEWHAVVHRMVYHHKAKLLTRVSDDEAHRIAEWLARSLPPSVKGVRIGVRQSGRVR